MTPERRTALAPLAGAAGFGVGLVAWRVLLALLAGFREGVAPSVEAAREAGIVSFTVLAGYDKHQEVVAWIAGCIIVPLAAWAAWTAVHPHGDPAFRVGRRRRGARRASAPGVPSADDRRAGPDRRFPEWLPWVGVAGTLLALAVRPGFVRGPSPWGTFGLLGEEGVYLGAVQALRSGRVLYADLDFPYGPLLIGSLDVWMRLFGDTVVAARTWVLLLHLAGVAGAAGVVRALLGPRSGSWTALWLTLSVALIAPLFLPNLNGVLLRPVLVFIPGALVFVAGRAAWGRPPPAAAGAAAGAAADAAEGDGEPDSGEDDAPSRRRRRLPRPSGWTWAGVSLPLAAATSFEIGPAAAVGLVVAIAIVRPATRDAIRIAVGFAVGSVAVLLPMALSGSLAGLLDNGRRMLTLPSQGYQALPYPDPLGLFEDSSGALGAYPPEDPATWAWAVVPPLVIWAGLATGVCAPRRGGLPTRAGAVLVAAAPAAILYRAALGRSDLYHLWFYGAAPVLLIAALILASAWERSARELKPIVPSFAAIAVLLLAAQGPEERVSFPDAEEERLAVAAGVANPLVPVSVDIGRTGRMDLLPRVARQVDSVVRRAADLPVEDGVWFYPSEATYWFLTRRPLPTRYLWAYDAATPAMQRQAIAELDETRPRWLFRSSDTFPIDHIPQDRLVPLLDEYLRDRYRVVEVLPGATLMERKE